jgi:hypothetical protein
MCRLNRMKKTRAAFGFSTIAVFALGAQAQECMLEVSGNPYVGSVYAAKSKFGALDAKKALESIRTKLQQGGVRVLALDLPSGTLRAEKPEPSGGKSRPLTATIRTVQRETEASISIKLNPLELSQPEYPPWCLKRSPCRGRQLPPKAWPPPAYRQLRRPKTCLSKMACRVWVGFVLVMTSPR